MWFEWGGPYLHDEYCADDACRMAWEERVPILQVNLVEWRMESSPGGTEDVLQIEWPDSSTLGFGFRSSDGECEENPTAVRTAAGCTLDH